MLLQLAARNIRQLTDIDPSVPTLSQDHGSCRGLRQLTTDKSRPEAHRFYTQLGFVASHEGMKLRL